MPSQPSLTFCGFPEQLLELQAPTSLLRRSSLQHLTQDLQGALPTKVSLREVLRWRLVEELGPRLAGNTLVVCDDAGEPLSPGGKQRLTLSASASLHEHGLLESLEITCKTSAHKSFQRCESMRDNAELHEMKRPLRDRVLEMIPVLVAGEKAPLACQASGLHFATADSASWLLEGLPAAVAEAIVDLALEKIEEVAERAAGKLYEKVDSGIDLVLSSAVGCGVQGAAVNVWNALQCCRPNKGCGTTHEEELAQQKDLAECLSSSAPLTEAALACVFQGKPGPKNFAGTLLFWAQKWKCRAEVLELLMDHHADPNARYTMWPAGTGGYVSSPLIAYAWNTCDYIIALMGAKADVNLNVTFNYFPQGNALFQACWFEREHNVDFLLAYNAEPSTFGWNSDSPPLGSSVESDGTSALAVAARNGMRRSVRALLDSGASAEQCLSDVFSSAHEDILCIIAKEMAIINPMKLLDANVINGVHHRILTTLYTHITGRSEAAGCIKDWLKSQEAQHSDFQEQLLEFIHLLITRAPNAAAVVMDGILLMDPVADTPSRNPLPLQCALCPDGRLNTAYVSSMTWKAGTEHWPWQEAFLQQGILMANWPFMSWPQPQKTHARDSAIAPVAPALQKVPQSEFCNVNVLCVQNVVEGRIFNAMKALSYQDKADLLEHSVAMQAIVSHAWFTWGCSWHMVGIIKHLGELICLILWWFAHVELDDGSPCIMACWAVYTSLIAQDILQSLSTSFILKPAYDRGASSVKQLLYSYLSRSEAAENLKSFFVKTWQAWNTGRELHACFRILLCISGYRSWHYSTIPEFTRIVLAVLSGLGLLGALAKMRKFRKSGESLVPIFNIMQSHAMQYMVMIFFAFLGSAFFFVLVQLEDYGDGAYGVKEKLVRIWQTFAVGESSVFAMGENPGDGGYSDPAWVYLVMCVLFFAINIMTLNILINVSGEAYAEQLRRIRQPICRAF
eukprot:TRINITY_DN26351_c0_g1_i1.p1 TRINITY_DN26351_c0_g1~~TRINITY_DN26351_c0_g1_i1.p1  ORF type:complete len:963 (-),score=155.44 TRINITY_DN26351_c0_g1_i1:2167-5055(-)